MSGRPAPRYADLHLHLGRAGDGRPVKVAASGAMTLPRVLAAARDQKGLDLVAVVDCASPAVRRDLRRLIERGELASLSGGGYLTPAGLGFIPAVEVEVGTPAGGRAHLVLYLPDLPSLDDFTRCLAGRVTNLHLSTQRAAGDPAAIVAAAAAAGGFGALAHAFTPHKGYFGRPAAPPLAEVFDLRHLPAIELGLSADSDLADCLPELAALSFVSSSDAHSLPAIAREYTVFRLAEPSLAELRLALADGGRHGRIVANYGLDPRLGKYHRSSCRHCGFIAGAACPPPVLACPDCGHPSTVVGVLDRVLERSGAQPTRHPPWRPPYVRQVPLANLPGVGPATRKVLLAAFGSEMAILHQATGADLAGVVGPALADLIVRARQGELGIRPGGGGRYGRVV